MKSQFFSLRIRLSYVKQNVHLGIIPDRRLRQLVDRLVVEHVPPIVAEAFADCPVVAGLRGAGMRRHGVQVVNAATLFGASDRERDHVQVFQRVGDEVFLLWSHDSSSWANLGEIIVRIGIITATQDTTRNTT